ncbi:MAG: 30S ribosomal protein S4 [bacterium]|nr:30S ribosomal protein S4 [bacterium]
MARYLGPSCRLCRAEGTKLFLKGARCYTAKCAFERRSTAPGMHGRGRQKPTEYGRQLREKQKLRRIYGILERQFRLYFARAAKKKGVTGDTLLTLLETRLDNVVYRAGFAVSRALARQIVRHAHITVNGKVVNIPSYQVRANDVIGVVDREKSRALIRGQLEQTAGIPAPEWLPVNKEELTASVARLPERGDINVPVNVSLVVELYSK